MGQCVVFSTADKAVVLTVLQTAHSVSFGKLLTFHKLFNLSFFLKISYLLEGVENHHNVPTKFLLILSLHWKHCQTKQVLI